MSLRTPLARVLGHGSAREGVSHWWAQRVTAVALVPLTLWFAASVLTAGSLDHAAVARWLAVPLNAVLLSVLVFTLFYHSQLGLRVVIEDYVQARGPKILALLASQFLHFLLGAVAIYSILRVAFAAAPLALAGAAP